MWGMCVQYVCSCSVHLACLVHVYVVCASGVCVWVCVLLNSDKSSILNMFQRPCLCVNNNYTHFIWGIALR